MKTKDRITLQQISTNSAPRKLERFRGRDVRIWSAEHGAWWRPHGRGYTIDPEEAGIFTFEDAHRDTCHCGPEKKIEYVLAA